MQRIDNWFWKDVDLRRGLQCRSRACSRRVSAILLMLWRCCGLGFMLSVGVIFWADVAASLFIYCFCAHDTITTYIFCSAEDKGKHISFLTHVSFWIVTSYMCFSLLNIFMALSTSLPFNARLASTNRQSDPAPRSCGLITALHSRRAAQTLLAMGVSMQVIVVALYWALVYDGDNASSYDWFQDLTIHVVACAVVWIDFVLSAARLPDRHSIIVGAAAIVYLFWNLGYVLNTDTYLYSVLKWNSVGSVFIALAAAVGVVIVFFIASAIAAALTRCSKARKPDAASTPKPGAVVVVTTGAPLDADPAFPERFTDDALSVQFPCTGCCNKAQQPPPTRASITITPDGPIRRVNSNQNVFTHQPVGSVGGMV